jgi:hypothetical protein
MPQSDDPSESTAILPSKKSGDGEAGHINRMKMQQTRQILYWMMATSGWGGNNA